jgi:ethanolamine ammonia-lyase large subunit
MYSATVAGNRYMFPNIVALLAKASPLRSGDVLAGIAAESDEQRVAAQFALADLPLQTLLDQHVVAYEADEITRLIIDTHDRAAFAPITHLTVGALRDWLLSDAATSDVLAALAPGLTPEMVAAVAKLCRAQDLILIAAKCRVVTRFRNTLGLPGCLSVRLQPNHPTDDPKGIAASILDGLLLGAGDAVIGINPATDSPERAHTLLALLDDIRCRLDIPTQSCVLAHVTTTLGLIEKGAPVDLVFQSIAGTQAANRSFGVDLALLHEARAAALALRRGTIGDNVMYFETGQGSALSANAHHGVDQQTLEARAYGVARAFKPLLVNTVVGFLGPEYLHDGKQIVRAGLEDHFCGKPIPIDLTNKIAPCRSHVARPCCCMLHDAPKARAREQPECQFDAAAGPHRTEPQKRLGWSTTATNTDSGTSKHSRARRTRSITKPRPWSACVVVPILPTAPA